MMDWLKLNDDEEPKVIAPGQKAEPTTPPPSLEERYKTASDDSDVKKARETADDRNMWVNLIRSMNQIAAAPSVARGGRGADHNFYEGLTRQNDEGVGRAEQDRKARMEGVLAQDRLQQQTADRAWAGKEHAHKETEWDRQNTEYSRLHTPGSDDVKAIQKWTSTIAPELAKGMETMSMAQIEKFYPTVFKAWEARQAKEAAKNEAGKPMQMRTRNSDGTEDTYLYDPKTKTKELVVSGRSASAAAQDARNLSDAQKATEAWSTRDKLFGDMQTKYDAASKEGPLGLGATGPVMGRVAGMARDAGFSAGENADALDNQLKNDAVKFLKDISGSQATDKEYARLQALLPRSSQDKEAFQRNLQSAKAYALKVANEKRRVAGLPELAEDAKPITEAPPPPQAKAPSSVYPKQVKNAAGETTTVDNEQEAAEAAAAGFN